MSIKETVAAMADLIKGAAAGLPACLALPVPTLSERSDCLAVSCAGGDTRCAGMEWNAEMRGGQEAQLS